MLICDLLLAGFVVVKLKHKNGCGRGVHVDQNVVKCNLRVSFVHAGWAQNAIGWIWYEV